MLSLRTRLSAAAVAALSGLAGVSFAQTPAGSAFTYQGKLTDQGQAANGHYDFDFALMDAPTAGTQIGNAVAVSNVQVTGGLFTVSLDFGATAFNGSARWLAIYVRPGGQIISYTPLTPLQPLTPAPYATGLSLPYSVTQGTPSSPLINVVQNGGADGGALAGTVLNGYGTAVYGQASGPGSIGVWGYNLATAGNAGFFRNENVGNASACLEVQSNGSGPVVNASTGGTGRVGSFINSNVNSFSPTLYAANSGQSYTLYSTNSGQGTAGYFRITNNSSFANALDVATSGTGYAGKFTGPVDVQGKLTTSYNGVEHRAAPLAYGWFNPYHASSSTGGSGNAPVTYMGNDVYRLDVSGGTSPSNWIVVVNVAYGTPNNPGITYEATAGVPNSQGQINIYVPCTSNCGGFGSEARVNFTIYEP